MSEIRRRPWIPWLGTGALALLGAWLTFGGLFGTTANSPYAGTPQFVAVACGILALVAAALLGWRLIARSRG